MGLVTGLITFVVGALVGGVGIYVGGVLVTGEGGYERAVTTALIGAVVWTVVGTFVGFIPLVGPILTFAAYLAVLQLAYPGGWAEAIGIAVVAWLTLVVVFLFLGPLIGGFDAVGVPGV